MLLSPHSACLSVHATHNPQPSLHLISSQPSQASHTQPEEGAYLRHFSLRICFALLQRAERLCAPCGAAHPVPASFAALQ
mmetsp:Transcript_23430/g.35061  ORF Transcript_23430/g.35061 Transcript_23430/m.35061 type:complete len:80 (-) Transcript_23430:66-305(-)